MRSSLFRMLGKKGAGLPKSAFFIRFVPRPSLEWQLALLLAVLIGLRLVVMIAIFLKQA